MHRFDPSPGREENAEDGFSRRSREGDRTVRQQRIPGGFPQAVPDTTAVRERVPRLRRDDEDRGDDDADDRGRPSRGAALRSTPRADRGGTPSSGEAPQTAPDARLGRYALQLVDRDGNAVLRADVRVLMHGREALGDRWLRCVLGSSPPPCGGASGARLDGRANLRRASELWRRVDPERGIDAVLLPEPAPPSAVLRPATIALPSRLLDEAGCDRGTRARLSVGLARAWRAAVDEDAERRVMRVTYTEPAGPRNAAADATGVRPGERLRQAFAVEVPAERVGRRAFVDLVGRRFELSSQPDGTGSGILLAAVPSQPYLALRISAAEPLVPTVAYAWQDARDAGSEEEEADGVIELEDELRRHFRGAVSVRPAVLPPAAWVVLRAESDEGHAALQALGPERVAGLARRALGRCALLHQNQLLRLAADDAGLPGVLLRVTALYGHVRCRVDAVGERTTYRDGSGGADADAEAEAEADIGGTLGDVFAVERVGAANARGTPFGIDPIARPAPGAPATEREAERAEASRPTATAPLSWPPSPSSSSSTDFSPSPSATGSAEDAERRALARARAASASLVDVALPQVLPHQPSRTTRRAGGYDSVPSAPRRPPVFRAPADDLSRRPSRARVELSRADFPGEPPLQRESAWRRRAGECEVAHWRRALGPLSELELRPAAGAVSRPGESGIRVRDRAVTALPYDRRPSDRLFRYDDETGLWWEGAASIDERAFLDLVRASGGFYLSADGARVLRLTPRPNRRVSFSRDICVRYTSPQVHGCDGDSP